MSEDLSLCDFGGIARLFPLPNLVLFPHVIQPLHIFEPRYRQMLADALDDDRLLALALLKPGWEEDYHKRPPIHSVVCLGRIFKEERLIDGRYNLLLHGVCRARIIQELQTAKLYRSARVELLPDIEVVDATVAGSLRERLGQVIDVCFATQVQALGQMRQLLQSQLPIGTLCDILAFALPLAVDFKQQLLEESDSERRTDRLLSHLDLTYPRPSNTTSRKWPPEFSRN